MSSVQEGKEKDGDLSAAALLVEAGFETLTDEMIGRLAKSASDTLTLLDAIHASGVIEALPILKELVASGDLARLSHVARLLGAAEDAVTDDLVSRLARLGSQGMTLLDRLGRGEGDCYLRLLDVIDKRLDAALLERLLRLLPSVLDLLEQASASGVLEDAVGAIARTRQELLDLPRPSGGVGGLWMLMKEAHNQRTLQALLVFARHALKIDVRS